MPRRRRILQPGLCLLILLAVTPPAMAYVAGPVPPCDDTIVVPAVGPAGALPTVQVWKQGDLPAQWTPPACSGWAKPGFRLMTAVVAQVGAADADPQQLFLTRLAAVSQMTAIRFWAITAARWETLVRSAKALDGPPPARPRADFTEADLIPGHPLFYTETDSGSGEDRYRMQVLERTPTRLVVETENTSTIRFFLLPLFHPGDLQALYILSRQPNGQWVFYGLARVGAEASSLIDSHAPSVINRMVAMYRYFAGIPTDMEPPAAR